MRILCLTDRLHGGGRYSMEHPLLEQVFAGLLPERGHSVLFWLHSSGPQFRRRRIPWHCAEIQFLPSAGARRGARVANLALRAMAVRMGLAGLIRRERIDIVQIRNDWVAALVAAPVLKRLGVPLVFQWSFPHPLTRLASIDAGYEKWPRLARWRAGREAVSYRRAIDAATHVLPISEWMQADLVEQGVPAEKMTALPLGFATGIEPDPRLGRSIRERYGLGDRPVVLYFGEMGRLRRMEFLIDAMADVRAEIPSARLLMVGAGDSGADIERLRRHAAARGIMDAVTFTGYVPRAEIPAFIAAADVGVSPIPPIPLFWISSPTKFIEMLGMACPVVASDIPEQRTILQASGGGISVPYEAGPFARAIVEILRRPEDARAMGRRGRDFIERERSLDRLADIVEHVYERVLADRGSGAAPSHAPAR